MTNENTNKKARAQTTQELLRSIVGHAGDALHFDLHIHTTVSDGSEGFERVILEASKLGLSHIAFTNHDTVVGLDYAIETGRQHGIEVLGGVEISACDPQTKKRIHILGYGLTSWSPAVTALCRPLLEQRTKNTTWQMNRLIKEGYPVDTEKVFSLSRFSTAFYKQHLMAGLTDEPYESSSYQELYTSLFKGNGIVARDIEYIDAFDAVKAIVKDGGVAVLAHPGQLDSYDFVPHLVECGLRGIEKYHPDHGAYDVALCSKMQEKYQLIVTGGSDYHGSFGAPTSIGLYQEKTMRSS